MSTQFDVFLSYSAADKMLAQQFVRALNDAGIRVWFDRGQIHAGDLWMKQLEKGLQQSGCIILLIGSSGVTSWQENELRVAQARQSKIITVVLPGVANAEAILQDYLLLHPAQWIDCRDWIPRECFDELIKVITGDRIRSSVPQIGKEFELEMQWSAGPKRKIRIGTLPNPDPTNQLHLTWATFERGIELLHRQISTYDLDFDACFGINDAGLVMASLLNHSVMFRKQLGYIRQKSIDAGRGRMLEKEYCLFPKLMCNSNRPNIMLVDFEVKADDAPLLVAERIRQEYKESDCEPRIYFATFGALTEKENLEIDSFDDITSANSLSALGLEAFFFAFTMHWPGIEPPLRLK